MKNIKYYVLGTKKSALLKEYYEKFYTKLLNNLDELLKKGILIEEIKGLLEVQNKEFILNPDVSSLIISLIINKEDSNLEKLKIEIKIFLAEGIGSESLIQNKGDLITGTSIKLTSQDNNPYNKNEAHPDHLKHGATSGNYGKKAKKEWIDCYKSTFSLLKEIDIAFFEEINYVIKKIVPLGTSEQMHNSASYKECIGHLYLGYTIDSEFPEVNNIEAVIHEFSHNKLNLVMHFDEVTLNKYEEKYYSSIRPDARPISGVFLGYHAFVPTMYVLMKAYVMGKIPKENMWLDKIVLYYIKTKFLQRVIKKHAILTDIGKEIDEELDYIISLTDILFKKINPPIELINSSKKMQKEHFFNVNKLYKILEY